MERLKAILIRAFSSKRIIYYSAIGLVVNITALFIYYFLVEFLSLKYQWSWLLSYLYALIASFLLNNYLTFKLRDILIDRFFVYLLSNVGFGFASFLSLLFFVEVVKINYFLSQILVILIFFPISFLYASKKVFKNL